MKTSIFLHSKLFVAFFMLLNEILLPFLFGTDICKKTKKKKYYLRCAVATIRFGTFNLKKGRKYFYIIFFSLELPQLMLCLVWWTKQHKSEVKHKIALGYFNEFCSYTWGKRGLQFTKEQICERHYETIMCCILKDLYEYGHKINYNLRLNKETIYMNIYGTFRNEKNFIVFERSFINDVK